MANENDNINQQNAENTDGQKPHHSLLENLGESISKLNTDFPLSGGETDEDLENVVDGDDTEQKETKPGAEPGEHHSIMENLMHKIQNLDSDFPLSGGETEEDFENADDEEEDEEEK